MWRREPPHPLQNRVTPFGELVADPGARARLRQPRLPPRRGGRIRRRYNGKRWIACRLEFKDWHRSPLLQPGRFTELFFLDEATAFAAGHRPCALCRREDYNRFTAFCGLGADAIDERLQGERLDLARGRSAITRRRSPAFPTGRSSLRDGEPWLVLGSELLHWTPAGYRDASAPGGRCGRRSRRRCSLRSCMRAGSRSCRCCIHQQPRTKGLMGNMNPLRPRMRPALGIFARAGIRASGFWHLRRLLAAGRKRTYSPTVIRARGSGSCTVLSRHFDM